MAPQELPSTETATDMDDKQSLFIIRHGDRWDYAHPEWLETTDRRGDPPLSQLGHQQARETGLFLDALLHSEGFSTQDEEENLLWLSSPFLRTIQTSNEILNAFQHINTDNVRIFPENSIWEMDGHNGKQHACLPPLEERKHYFPRLDINYESIYTPPLPEARNDFLGRCDRALEEMHKDPRFAFKPKTAIVLVSHAAACVGLTRAAANVTLQDVNPAGPCGIFRLTRSSNTPVWEIDHYAKESGLNGHLNHLTEMGSSTYPWNHFGDKAVNRGYTGPPKDCPLAEADKE